jgi:hypothetical protein
LKENSLASMPTGNTYVEVVRMSMDIKSVDYSHDLGILKTDTKGVHFNQGRYDCDIVIIPDNRVQLPWLSDVVSMTDLDKWLGLTLHHAGEITLFGYCLII